MFTYVNDKTVKNWNIVQNAADSGGGGVFYQCEEYACMLYEICLLAYFSQSVRYWYKICNILVPIFMCYEELVPILHSEIYEVWNFWV